MAKHNYQNDHISGVLEVDLGAIKANYAAFKSQVGDATVAAALKADAYGLGMDRIAPALADAGCADFFGSELGMGDSLCVDA